MIQSLILNCLSSMEFINFRFSGRKSQSQGILQYFSLKKPHSFYKSQPTEHLL